MSAAWPAVSLRRLERDLRHAPRAHPGARQDRGRARPARASVPALGAARHRARVGDGAATRARRLGRARGRARSANPRGGRRAHRTGASRRVPLTPDRPVGEVTRALLEAVGELVGAVEINPTPQEVSWTVPLDEDDEHASYDTGPGQRRTSRRRRRPRSYWPRSARRTAAGRRRSTPGGGRSTWP